MVATFSTAKSAPPSDNPSRQRSSVPRRPLLRDANHVRQRSALDRALASLDHEAGTYRNELARLGVLFRRAVRLLRYEGTRDGAIATLLEALDVEFSLTGETDWTEALALELGLGPALDQADEEKHAGPVKGLGGEGR